MALHFKVLVAHLISLLSVVDSSSFLPSTSGSFSSEDSLSLFGTSVFFVFEELDENVDISDEVLLVC